MQSEERVIVLHTFSFGPVSNHMNVLLLFALFMWGQWCTIWLNNLPEIIRLIRGTIGIQQICRNLEFTFFKELNFSDINIVYSKVHILRFTLWCVFTNWSVACTPEPFLVLLLVSIGSLVCQRWRLFWLLTALISFAFLYFYINGIKCCSLLSGFFRTTSCLRDSSILLKVVFDCSFSLLCSFPLCTSTTVYLSILLLMTLWVVSRFWILTIVIYYEHYCMCLFCERALWSLGWVFT